MNPQQDGLRISDADREQAASDLSGHYAEGRLSHDEHAERLDAIWTARTQADLAPIFEDLPARRSPGLARPPQGHRRWRGVPFLPIAVALVLLSILTHLPFLILIFFVGYGLGRRTRMHRAY
jgi:hypothetical protein